MVGSIETSLFSVNSVQKKQVSSSSTNNNKQISVIELGKTRELGNSTLPASTPLSIKNLGNLSNIESFLTATSSSGNIGKNNYVSIGIKEENQTKNNIKQDSNKPVVDIFISSNNTKNKAYDKLKELTDPVSANLQQQNNNEETTIQPQKQKEKVELSYSNGKSPIAKAETSDFRPVPRNTDNNITKEPVKNNVKEQSSESSKTVNNPNTENTQPKSEPQKTQQPPEQSPKQETKVTENNNESKNNSEINNTEKSDNDGPNYLSKEQRKMISKVLNRIEKIINSNFKWMGVEDTDKNGKFSTEEVNNFIKNNTENTKEAQINNMKARRYLAIQNMIGNIRSTYGFNA